MTKRLLALGVLLFALAALAGCGDDGGETTLATSSLDKGEFVKEANKACREERSQLLGRVSEYQEDGGTVREGAPDYKEMITTVYLPTIEAEVAAVRDLGAPAGEEENVEELLAAQQEAIDEVEGQDIERFEQVEQTFGEASGLMLDYGLSACSAGRPADEGD